MRLTHPFQNLDDDRQWRALLLLLFVLQVVSGFLLYLQMGEHPVGRPEEWAGTESYYYYQKAQEIASVPNWVVRSAGFPNMLVSRSMVDWAPPVLWEDWIDNRLPRGAAALYLMAFSFGLTQSLALYRLAALLGSGLLAILVAGAGARIFEDRRAGALAGVLVSLQQTLTLSALVPGPWFWEALVFAAFLYTLWRAKSDAQNPAEWALVGLVIAFGIWLRPFFWWGLPAALLAIVGWNLKPNLKVILAILIPVAISTGGLLARNTTVDSTSAPVVGLAAWDFANTVHPRATEDVELPPDRLSMEAGDARFAAVFRTTLQRDDYRAALPSVLERKLREFFGARDVAESFNSDYAARRFTLVPLTTLAPDVTMALGLAALVLLLAMGRLPRGLVAALGLLTLHALLFRTSGFDRLMLHTLLALLSAAALVHVWSQRRTRPALPFVLLALWAMFHLGLQIDDQARGSRYRGGEFSYAIRQFQNRGMEREAALERADYQRMRTFEGELRGYWSADR